MSSSSTNPRAYPNSLLARLDALERGQARLVAAQPGKIKTALGTNSLQGFAWAGTTSAIISTPCSCSISVPQFATQVTIMAFLSSVVCCNSSSSAVSYSYLWGDFPDFGTTQSNGSNVYVQINQQQQRSRALSLAQQPIPAGLSSIQVRANGSALNTGTNADNALEVVALAIFQY